MAGRRGRPWQRGAGSRWESPAAPRRGVRTRRADLHRYDVAAASKYSLELVREAYENGYQFVELVHGAADVTDAVEPGEGRGGIKTELRRMLDRGEFDSYLQPRSQQQVLEGMLRLAIRPNPRPRPESWTDAPAPRYG